MTLERWFINAFYHENYRDYLKARKSDYCKVQLEWTYFLDSLCKDGKITQSQYNNAVF